MMKGLKKSVFAFLPFLAVGLMVSGCGKKKVKQTVEPTRVVQTERQPWPDVPFDRKRFEKTDSLVTVYFDFDRYLLTNQAKSILEKNAAWLKANPLEEVLIEGHCDERGSVEYNIALGEKRAVSVRDYYAALGIGAKRTNTKSWGEERPQDPRSNEEAWAKNRRAETLIRVE